MDMEFAIGTAAKMTGVPVDTLRVWERRYGVPRPTRRRGRRLYPDGEIARLRLVASLLAAGHRTSDVVALPREDLERLVTESREASPTAGTGAPTPFACLDALQRGDAARFGAELRRASLLYGPLRFVTEVAHPLATRVGALWERGELDVHQEHLFTASLSTQMQVLLSMLESVGRSPVVLLATLPGELHALGLEMTAVYLAARGASPRLLGPNCPPAEIAAAAGMHRADVIGISVSLAAKRASTLREIEALAARTEVPIWLGGGGAPRLGVHGAAFTVLETARKLDGALAAMQTPRGSA